MVVKYILCLPHRLLEMMLEWPFEFGNTPLWIMCFDANSVLAYLVTHACCPQTLPLFCIIGVSLEYNQL